MTLRTLKVPVGLQLVSGVRYGDSALSIMLSSIVIQIRRRDQLLQEREQLIHQPHIRACVHGAAHGQRVIDQRDTHTDIFVTFHFRDAWYGAARCTARTITVTGRFQQSGLRSTFEHMVHPGSRP